MSDVKSSPATRMFLSVTMPPSAMTAISEVPPPDVNDHVAHGFFNINADSNGCGHGFVYEIDILSSGMLCAIANGTFFYLGYSGRDTDDHAKRRREPALPNIHHFDHAFDHFFSSLKNQQ